MSFNYLSPKAETRNSDISNHGTFAKQPIVKGELIAIFGGHVMDSAAVQSLPEAARFMVLQVADDQFIGSRAESEFGVGDFVNHSCEPNAGIKGQIFLVAMRDIAVGEEITFDYAMTISAELFARMECSCKSKKCRGVVTCNDWQDKKLQQKYAGYFSYHIQEKIDVGIK
jgi:SET domain-containing protein